VVALAGVAVVLYTLFGPSVHPAAAPQSNADFNAAQSGFLAY
jgi:hypothetical protein